MYNRQPQLDIVIECRRRKIFLLPGMEGIKNIVKARVKARNKNIHSEIHYWTDVISSAFHERKRFAMYLGIIKRIGVKEAQRIFTEIKDSNAKSPGKLFVWKAGSKGRRVSTKSPPLR